MKLTKTYNNDKAFTVADSLARSRGYDGLANIDDPGLREWIWERAEPHVMVKHSLALRLPFLLTSGLFVLILGLLLGTLI